MLLRSQRPRAAVAAVVNLCIIIVSIALAGIEKRKINRIETHGANTIGINNYKPVRLNGWVIAAIINSLRSAIAAVKNVEVFAVRSPGNLSAISSVLPNGNGINS